MTSRWLNRLIAGLLLVSSGVPIQPVSAQGRKFFAYNNTTRTDFTGVYMAPAGSENWGQNQALNDNDSAGFRRAPDAHRAIARHLLGKASRSLGPDLHLAECGFDQRDEFRDT